MENAKSQSRNDLYWLAFQRLCHILGLSTDGISDPITFRLERSVRAFEELRGGRPASRTRQMMARRGSVGTIKQWLTYDAPTEGYRALVVAGLWDLLGEAIPLDFPAEFTSDEINIARYRIDDAKIGRVSQPFRPRL